MVQGYKQHRYFVRRGTRTVPMREDVGPSRLRRGCGPRRPPDGAAGAAAAPPAHRPPPERRNRADGRRWKHPAEGVVADRERRCRRRGAQDERAHLVRGGQADQALRTRAQAQRPGAPLPADDRDAAQRQGGGLPALHGAHRQRPLQRPPARWLARDQRRRRHAAHGQRGATDLRGPAAVPERRSYTVEYELSDQETYARDSRVCGTSIRSRTRTCALGCS